MFFRQAVDLTWLIRPGTISGSLLTGMLGLQPSPTVMEVAVYALYAVPMALYVLWPNCFRGWWRRDGVSDLKGAHQGPCPEPRHESAIAPALTQMSRNR